MRLATLCCLTAVACTGGDDSGDPTDTGDTGDGEVVFPDIDSTPIAATWQRLYGTESTGTRDNEGLVGLTTAADGTVYALADRRYRDDPGGPELLLLSYAADGTPGVVKSLTFDSGPRVFGFAALPSGNLVLVLELSELTVLQITTAGETVWSTEITRDPYAFGGLTVKDLAAGPDGDVYLAGHMSPSEADSDRSYLCKLGADGSVAWTRSWTNDQLIPRQRIAVGGAGAFVADVLDVGIDESRMVLAGFNAGGGTLGQVDFTEGTGAAQERPFIRAGLFVRDSDVLMVGQGLRARDGVTQHRLHRMTLDPSLVVTAQDLTVIPVDGFGEFPEISLRAGASGELRAVLDIEESPAVLAFGPDEAPMRAYSLARADGSTPLILDDDDLPVFSTGLGSAQIAIGATSLEAGGLTLTQRRTGATTSGVAASDAGLMITSETFLGATGAGPVVSDDDLGTFDADGPDQDALVLAFEL